MGEPEKTEPTGLTDSQLEALLSLSRAELKERSKQLTRDELVRLTRLATKSLATPGAGTAAKSKINLDKLEDSEKTGSFLGLLDPTRPQKGPPVQESMFRKVIGTPAENRGISGLPGKASGAITNVASDYLNPQSLKELHEFNFNFGAGEEGGGQPPASAREQVQSALTSLDSGLRFTRMMIDPSTEEAATAGAFAVEIAKMVGKSWWETIIDKPGGQEDLEVMLNTVDFATLGTLGALKSKTIIKTLDEAVRIGVRTAGPGETAAALDAVATSTNETIHLARNAGDKPTVDRLKALLDKIEKKAAAARSEVGKPAEQAHARLDFESVKAENLVDNSEEVLGLDLARLETEPPEALLDTRRTDETIRAERNAFDKLEFDRNTEVEPPEASSILAPTMGEAARSVDEAKVSREALEAAERKREALRRADVDSGQGDIFDTETAGRIEDKTATEAQIARDAEAQGDIFANVRVRGKTHGPKPVPAPDDPEDTLQLMRHIRDNGGLADDAGEGATIAENFPKDLLDGGQKGRFNLIQPNGMTIDDLSEFLQQEYDWKFSSREDAADWIFDNLQTQKKYNVKEMPGLSATDEEYEASYNAYLSFMAKKNPEAGSAKTGLMVHAATATGGAAIANYLYNEPGKYPYNFLAPTIIGGLSGLVFGNALTSPAARKKLLALISAPGTALPRPGVDLIDALIPNRYIGSGAAEAFGKKAALGVGGATGALAGGFAGSDEGEGFDPLGAGLGAAGGLLLGAGAGEFINLKRLFKGGFNPNLAAKKLFSRSGGMDPAYIANRDKLRRELSSVQQRIADALLPVLRAVDKDPEVGNTLSAIARGFERDTTGISEKVLDANSEIRGLFDELGLGLIRVGLAQGKAAETIVENVGTYLPRLYMAHERSDSVDTIVRYMGRNGIPRDRLGDLAGLKKRKDLTQLERRALEEITEEFGTGNPGLLGVKRLPRTAADIYVADNARFIASSPDLSIPIGTSKKIGSRLDETKVLFSEGGTEIREWSGRRYIKMGDNRNLGDIRGRWVEEAIANDMNTMVELPGAFRQVIDMGTALFKSAKVVWNMGTLFRNNVSNYLQADSFGGLSMANLNIYSQAFADYLTNSEGKIAVFAKTQAERGAFKDVAGGVIGGAAGAISGDDVDPLKILGGAVGGAVLGRATERARVFLGGKPVVGRPERYKMWRDKGLFEGGWFPTEVEKFLPEIFKPGYTGDEKTVAGIFAKLRHYTLDQGSKWHQASEQFSKVAMANYALDTLKMTPEQAVAVAQKYIYNYQDVPKIIDFVKRSPVGAPFITFSYKTIPRVGESAISFGSLAEIGKVPKQLMAGEFGAAAGSVLNNKFVRFWKWPAAIGAMNEYTAHLFGLKEGENPTTPLGAATRFAKDALARPFAKLRDVVMDGMGIGDVTGLKEHLQPWKGPFQVFLPYKDQFDRVNATDLTWNLPWGGLDELNQDRFGPSSPWWQTGVAMTTGLYELTQKPVITPEATAAQAALDANEFIWKQWGPTWAAEGYGSEKVRKSFQGPSEANPNVVAPSTAILNLLGVPKSEPVVPGASLRGSGYRAEERIRSLDKQKDHVLKTIESPSEKELTQRYVQSELSKSKEFMSTKDAEAQERIRANALDVKLSDLAPDLRSKAKKLLELTMKQMRIQIEENDKVKRAQERFPSDVFFPEKTKEGLKPKNKGSKADQARETLEFLKGKKR